MEIINITPKLKKILLGLFVSILIMQCKDPEILQTTSISVNITGYFEENQEEFSEFSKMLELTGNSGFLNAYGSYTCFAPTNEAIAKFLDSRGVASVDAMDIEELKDIVKLHLIQDTISTKSFTDGKINRLTMYGQYLITGAINENGTSYIRVNRQANIIKSNIVVQNGLIHVINGVLQPTKLTVAQLVEQNPAYSIFTLALKETGFYDSLNAIYKSGSTTNRNWVTLIGQSDAVFAEMGIHSYDDLRLRYSTKGNPKDPTDSLYLFVGYHILKDSKYIADLITVSSHTTFIPLEIITVKLNGQDALINEDEFNGVVEPGAKIDRETSDNTAINGVLHGAIQNFAIKVRKPIPIYWQVTDQPELRTKAVYRALLGGNLEIKPGELKDVTWGNSATNTLRYTTAAINGGGAPYVNYDYFSLSNSCCRGQNNHINWIEFVTPLIVKGKYKLWMTSTDITYNDIIWSFDGVAFPKTMVGRNVNPTTNAKSAVFWPSNVLGALSESEAEAIGFKYFNPAPTKIGTRTYFGRLIGTVEVTTTGRHLLKMAFQTNDALQANGLQIDMIQIIPVENDQIWPKFMRDGTRVEKP